MHSSRLPSRLDPNPWSALLASHRREGRRVLDLTAANPTVLGLSPLAEAGALLARAGAPAYDPAPLGSAAARAAVARSMAGCGVVVSPEDVVLTASTSESYAHLFRALAAPGETVAAPTPSYPLFEPLARAEGVTLRPYRLAFDGEWHLDRESFANAVAGARAVIVVEPNHPTGSVLAAAERGFVLECCRANQAALISDEVFADFRLEASGAPLRSWLGEDARTPLFVLGGLSKACGLPQLKVGWILLGGTEPVRAEARAALEWLGDLFLGVGTPVQTALEGLLELRQGFVTRVRERSLANLRTLDACVARHRELTRLPARAGWTALVRVPSRRDDEAWALALLERGVAVHPGHFYELEGGDFLAFSLIVPPDEFAAGLAVFEDVLAT